MHLVRYEDMHSDPHAAFAAVARFLGLPCDRKRIAAAVEAAAFPRLQAQERAAGFIEKPIRSPVFFREGRVDGWRQVLTAEQASAYRGRARRRHASMRLRHAAFTACSGAPARHRRSLS